MRAATQWLAGGVLLLATVTGCGGTDIQPEPDRVVASPAEEKFRTHTDLECLDDRTSAQVIDYVAGAVGEATPEQAARRTLDADGIDRAGLTERVTTDAAGSTFVDYLTDDGRLVLYVEPQPGAQDTWLAAYVTACADLHRGPG